MTLAFVPLVAEALRKADAGGPMRLKPAPSGFEPTTLPPPSEPAAAAHVHRDPKITLERQGDTITHIRIECGCGEVIELKCSY